MRRFLSISLLLMSGLVSANQDYQWSALKIGGAGWVTGLAIHPTQKDLVIIRTDVGGAYRWLPQSQSWQQLILQNNVQAADGSQDYDVASIAVSASAPETMYLAVGTDYNGDVSAAKGAILKSVDGGANWTRSTKRWSIGANLEGRQGGERLAIDPANDKAVFFGSRREGLWVSRDAGASWQRNTALPAGDTGNSDSLGIKFLLFDPATQANGNTARVYASVEGLGIFRSDDNGNSWRNILDTSDIGFDAEVSSTGELVVAFINNGSVQRYSPDADQWLDITPFDAQVNFGSVAIDPFNPQRIFVAEDGLTDGGLYRTLDGGASWDSLSFDVDESSVPWRGELQNDYLSVSSMAFDPVVANRLWYPEGFGVFRTSDLSDTNVTFKLFVEGIEELVSNDVVAPPGQKPVTAHWDAPLFRHPTPGGAAYNAQLEPGPRFNSAWSLDYVASKPQHIVTSIYDHRFCCEQDGQANQSGFSKDGGRTWSRFASLDNGTHPDTLRFGNIAVASSNSNKLVWLPTFDEPLHYSDDGGSSWKRSDLPGADAFDSPGSHFAYYLNRHVLSADRVLPQTFYLYHDYLGASRSDDGGKSWVSYGFNGLYEGAFFNAKLKAAPGVKERLYFTPGSMDGIDVDFYTSGDGGKNWQTISRVTNVEAFGFGKPAANATAPTLFIAGEVDGARGIWRSIDEGSNWIAISDAPLGIYNDIKALSGNLDTFGEVYVGFAGVGFAVGKQKTVEPPVVENTGNGLVGRYYDSLGFRNRTRTRIDKQISFFSGRGIPKGSRLTDGDRFSVRWLGFIKTDFTEEVELSTLSDDGVRVWINNRRIINNWTNHPLTEDTVSFTFEAGKRYRIRVDYFERTGASDIELGWKRAGESRVAIPTQYLYTR